MTISNQDGRSGPFNGTSSDGGSTGTFTFAYDFKALDQSHLVVTVTTTSTGAAVTKTLTTDYAVSGVGTDSGGNVTFVAGKAPLSTETVTITRAVPLTQLTDLQNRGGVQPSVLEDAFDKLTQVTQDTKEVQARTLRFPVGSTLSGIEMPLTATNNAAIAWSSDGTKLVNGPTSSQISSAESNATAAASSAVTAANEASATAPKYSFSTTTSVADPGTGIVRLNHATASSASIIVLDDQTADTGNPNVEDWLKTFDDSTSTIKGWIRLVEAGTPANYAIYNVTGITDSSGFIQVAVSHVDSNFASGSTFGNSAGLRLFFARTGDKGDTGSTGSTGPAGPGVDTLTTRGDLLVHGASSAGRLAIGSSGRALLSDGTDPSWGQVSLTAGVTGTLPAGNGGTGVTSLGSGTLLTSGAHVSLSAGISTDIEDMGSSGTGTETVDLQLEALKTLTINGNFTLAPDASRNGISVILSTNSGGGHTMTTSGWDHVIGEFDNTASKKHLFTCYSFGATDILRIEALS